ncbi:MAG: chitinase [Lachnospiraceae bacterium]|nr:chitinase [Lachnospiraceae bacterium]
MRDGNRERTVKRVRKHRQKYLPVLVAVLLIVIVAGVSLANGLFEELIPTGKEADLNEYFNVTSPNEAAVILNKEISPDKALFMNGIYYFPISMANGLNDIFYYDGIENRLFATTAAAVNEAGTSDFLLNGETVYISIDFIKKFANLSYKTASGPARIVLQTVWDKKDTAKAKKRAYMKAVPDKKADIVKKLEEGETVEIISANEAYSYCLTDDCFVGYVETDKLEDHAAAAETPVSEVPPIVYPVNRINGNVVIGWHNVTNDTANSMLSDAISRVHGMNVICPTWFALSGNDGAITSIASHEYVEEAHNNGLQVWGLLDNFSDETDTEAVLSRTSSRQTLVNNIINAAVEYGLDGINIDFELLPASAGDDFAQFLRELSIICHSKNIILSSDNYVPQEYTNYYRRDIQGKVCDYLIIMGYDEHTSVSHEAGSVASIGFVTDGIVNTLKDVPAEKVINGIPFYTRRWSLENGVLDSAVLGMADASAWLSDNGQSAVWDDATCQNVAVFDKNGVTYSIWLEDAQSVSAKLSVMKNNNLAGVACWRLMMETSDIWDVISAFYPVSGANELSSAAAGAEQ